MNAVTAMIMIVILPVFFSVVLTGILCRRRLREGKAITVWVAIIGSAIATLLTMLALTLLDAPRNFTLKSWLGDAKPGAIEILGPLTALLLAISIPASSIVVGVFQRKQKAALTQIASDPGSPR